MNDIYLVEAKSFSNSSITQSLTVTHNNQKVTPSLNFFFAYTRPILYQSLFSHRRNFITLTLQSSLLLGVVFYHIYFLFLIYTAVTVHVVPCGKVKSSIETFCCKFSQPVSLAVAFLFTL